MKLNVTDTKYDEIGRASCRERVKSKKFEVKLEKDNWEEEKDEKE